MEPDNLVSFPARILSNSSKRHRCTSSLILISQFLERTAFYSLLANLILLLNGDPYHWSSYNAMGVAFIFTGVTYIMALLGGIIAESCLGKFKTILIGFVFYIGGYFCIPFLNIERLHHHSVVKPASFCDKFTSHSGSESLTTPSSVNLGSEICSGYVIMALVLVATGCGIIKSVIAPFGADQVRYESPALVRSFFNWFYFVLNSGTFVAYLFFAYVQQNIDPFWGYMVPCILLCLSAIIFTAGCSLYRIHPPTGSTIKGIFGVLKESFYRRFCVPCRRHQRAVEISRQNLHRPDDRDPIYYSHTTGSDPNMSDSYDDLSGAHWSVNLLDLAKVRYGGSYHESVVEDVKIFGRVLVVLFCMLPYWLVYFQMESAFIVQGLHMKLAFNFTSSHQIQIPASWLTLFNVVALLFILPLLDRVIYPRLDKRGRSPSLQTRMAIGMVFSFIAVGLAGLVEWQRRRVFHSGGRVAQIIDNTTYYAADMSIFVQIPQYVFIGIGEAFTSVAGLEFAYSQSPKSMQSLINGIYWFMSGSGSFLGVILVVGLQKFWFYNIDYGNINYIKTRLDLYFSLLCAIQVVGIAAFLMVWRFYPVRTPVRPPIGPSIMSRDSPHSI